jgi:L-lactate dehydrogenase complex protein LldG
MNEAKEQILNSIRTNNVDLPTLCLEEILSIPTPPKSDQPILEVFKTGLTAATGTWRQASSTEEAGKLIKTLHPDAKVICSATPEIQGNKDLSTVVDPHDLDDVDVGIIRTAFGVAETGMVWLSEKELHINALGFLSQHLIILLDPQEIVWDMYEAYARIDFSDNNYGCLMMGPSATADIGAYMVHGAQGARSLTVIFL